MGKSGVRVWVLGTLLVDMWAHLLLFCISSQLHPDLSTRSRVWRTLATEFLSGHTGNRRRKGLCSGCFSLYIRIELKARPTPPSPSGKERR